MGTNVNMRPTAIVAACVASLFASAAWGWVAKIVEDHSSEARSVAIDAAGDIVATGILGNSIGVAKFRRVDGFELWRRVLSGSFLGAGGAVVLDQSGDAIVAGKWGVGGFAVVKLAGADGTDRWIKHLHGTCVNSPDSAYDVAVDGAGNIIATGRLNCHFTIIKFNSAGDELWRYQPVMGTAYSVIAAPDGSIFAAGSTGRIFKLNGNGTEIWRYQTNLDPVGLALDASGDVVAACAGDGIVRVSAAGAELWRRTDLPSAGIAIDNSGNIIAGDGGLTVTKLDSAGNNIWQYAIGPGGGTGIAIDAADNIFASGSLGDCGPSGCLGSDMIVAKLNTAGTELWRTTLDGPATGEDDWDVLGGVVIDQLGDAVAPGFTSRSSGIDFTVLKVSGATGGSAGASCGNGLLEVGETCDDSNTADGDGCSALCREDSAPESVTAFATPGVPVTTDGESDGTTSADPIETWVTSPSAGTVSISEQPLSGGSAQYMMLGMDIQVSAPPASAETPLVLVFRLDASRVPEGEDETTVQLFRNGAAALACAGSPGTASPSPCVSSRVALPDGDIEITVLSATASQWNLGSHLQAQRVEGTKLLLKDPANASNKKIVFKSVARSLIMGAPGSANDPTCGNGNGARIEIFNTAGSGELQVFDLPCEHWSVLGRPGNERGYKYRDADLVSGPVKTMLIKKGRKIGFVAQGAQIAYTLDEPTQSSIGVSIVTGSSAGYCTDFVAGISRDEPGYFNASGSVAPAACP